MKKKLILLLCLLLCLIPQKGWAGINDPAVLLNGKPLLERSSTLTQSGKMWVSARDLSNALTWQIEWQPQISSAVLQDHDGHTYVITTTPSSDDVMEGKVFNKKLYLPLRTWAETVAWDIRWTPHGTFLEQPTLSNKAESILTADGAIALGMPANDIIQILGEPQESYQQNQQQWLFYIDRYAPSHFSIIGIKDQQTNYIATTNESWQTEAGWSPLMMSYEGPTAPQAADATLLIEKGKKQVHTILLTGESFSKWLPDESYERAVYHLINAYRDQSQLITMADDADLKSIAQQHNLDMKNHHYISHTSYNGNHLKDRLQAYPQPWEFGAENIAYGKNNPCTNVNAWINSNSGHRETLLGDYRSVGISAVDYHNQALVTANFIR